jgi:RHS repeat-associated protein
MSGKSNTPGSIISLPQGGGALQGIGETFSPDLQTGTGNFSVPISLPPGRNGLQPQLTLQYSTGNGNGPFGLGWGLSIPGVSRKTSSGIPRYDDTGDTFLLSGAEDLVPVPVSGALAVVTRYRPRTEGLFARIDHYRDAQDNYWRVGSKDGLVSYYGTPRPVDAAPDWQDPGAITDPLYPSHVFAWKLSQTVDLFGNRIEYVCERDAVRTDGPHHWDQVYLSEIRYADYGDPNAPQFLVSVRFTYEQRQDPFSTYKSGFEIRTVRRCTRIDVLTNPGAETSVRTYHLTYLDQRGFPAGQLPPNGVSLLSQIQVEGHDGPKSEWMPPLEFGYTQFEPQRRRFSPVTGIELPSASLANPAYELADLLGNGLPDILEMNGTVRYWRNLGGGRFDLPRPMRDAPSGLQLADPGVQLLDADGDGRVDLLVTTPTISGYFPMGFDGLWDRRSFHRYRVAPSFNLEDPEVRLVDLNGDGVTDALRSSTRFDCFFNDPETGWGETRRVERKAMDVFPNVDLSDPRVKWADLSGDGMQDIALVHDGTVDYWPNLGYGSWGKRIHMTNSPRLPWGYNPQRILLGDVDGDGLADIVYVDDRRITLWINQSGNAWSDPIVIEGTPPVTDMDSVRLTDLLGVGTAGVLWTANVTALPRQRMFFLDFTGAAKPYLVNEMNNHIGSITRVAYASSTSFYLQDQQQLATQWQTPLPLPVQVVARVEAIDAISGGKLTTEYSYHHGYWDGAEREFRGFGRVDHRDTEVFADYHATDLHDERPFNAIPPKFFSPPTETRTWFHLGPVGEAFGGWTEADFSSEFWADDPQVLSRPKSMTAFLDTLPRRVQRDALRALHGQILRSEFYALDGTPRQNHPYTVIEYLRGVREEAPPGPGQVNRRHIFFPFDISRRNTQWERGEDPMTQFIFAGTYDSYGQPVSQCSLAVPRGRDFREQALPGDPYLATLGLTTYAHDAQRYCVNRVARSSTYEILNDGSSTVFQLAADSLAGKAPTRIVGQSYTFYDGPAFQGLPLGQLGDYGTSVRTETLVLTEQVLSQAYRSGDTVLNPPEEPPYLARSGPTPWSAEYPPEFRSLLPSMAAYVFHSGGPTAEDARGYFMTTARRYDFQGGGSGATRGLVTVQRDALGRDTRIVYDSPYELLPISVTDPANLITSAAYDYRVLQVRQVTAANGNSTSFEFTPLGLLASTWVKGKAGEGDQNSPSIRREYRFLAFDTQQQPIWVRTVRRTHHDTETGVTVPQRDETIETIEYSDGLGRLIQTRAQAEDVLFGDAVFGGSVVPADQAVPSGDATGMRLPPGAGQRVVVSGWQVYDNKGQVVEKYEPFFSVGWDYLPPTSGQLGQKISVYYDPRGHAIRTLNPDGSEQLVVYGVPGSRFKLDLTNPAVFEPTPWEAYTYDANDNSGRTNPATSVSYQSHWNTPASIVVDALGRTITAVVRNGMNPATDWYATRSTYDIQGNLLSVTDAQGRLAFQYVYDLARSALRMESIDAGIRRSIVDASGKVIELRDSKGALTLHASDKLNRPIRLWARDGTSQVLSLRVRLIYGDGADSGFTRPQAAARNLLGKLFRQYDEAGLLTNGRCDFKGNLVEQTREVISNQTILGIFNPPPANWQVQAFRVDWQPPGGMTLDSYAATLLDSALYQTSTTFDALNRIETLLYPEDISLARKLLKPRYNRAGALEHLDFGGVTYVELIAYNAKGQRSLIAYGNGLMTRYAYDPQMFRLARLRSERYTMPATLTYHSNGPALQDYAYMYDPVGNVLSLSDRTPGSGIPNTALGTEALDRAFTYDPIYHLLTATGRECDTPFPPPPWDDTPRCTDPTLACAYTESYSYDSVGNLSQMGHSLGATRVFTQALGTNRLATTTIGMTDFAYAYDINGNLIQENTSRHFEWDYGERMRVYRTQVGNAEPSIHAHYLYDAAGQRVKKLVRKQGGRVEVTVYVAGLFEFQAITQGGATQENTTLHVLDNQSRIALVRIGSPFPADTTPPVKYYLGDHLGSGNVVTDSSGALINREEYTPFGETSFGSFARKRYRFTGKERDEESGLYYHGARYYAPWLARWTSCDPAGFADGLNLYAYVKGNPIGLCDPGGTGGADPDGVVRTPGTTGASLFHKGKEVQFLPAPETTLDTDPAFSAVAKEVRAGMRTDSYQNFRTNLNQRIKAILKGPEEHALQKILEVREDALYWKAGTAFAGQELNYAHTVAQESIKNLGADEASASALKNLSPVGKEFHLKTYGHPEEIVTAYMKNASQEASTATKAGLDELATTSRLARAKPGQAGYVTIAGLMLTLVIMGATVYAIGQAQDKPAAIKQIASDMAVTGLIAKLAGGGGVGFVVSSVFFMHSDNMEMNRLHEEDQAKEKIAKDFIRARIPSAVQEHWWGDVPDPTIVSQVKEFLFNTKPTILN